MNRIIIIICILIFSSFAFPSYGDGNMPNQIHIQHRPKGGTHSGIPFVPMDMPDVYYDDVTDEIIIDGNGYSAYYDVEIVSESTLLTVLSANVDGDYDTIDISSLPDDNYTIVITSSEDNQYEGHFTN